MRLPRAAALATVLSAITLGASACGGGATADVENGKVVFQQKCAGCHALADAGPTAAASSLKAGPNLDDAFRGSREHGFKESQFESLVNYWIEKAAQKPWRLSPQGKAGKPAMARDIVDGQDQADVAAYVAHFAGIKGDSAVVPIPAAPAKTSEGASGEPTPPPGDTTAPAPADSATAGGTVKIEADPNALAFKQTSLDAAAGKVTFDFTNAASFGHNFAILRPGSTDVLAETETIQDGATSSITVDLAPGTYEYVCTVPGHEAMKGTLYVTDAANQAAPAVKGPRIVGPWISARLRDRRISQLKPAVKAKSSPIDSYSLPGYWIRILP